MGKVYKSLDEFKHEVKKKQFDDFVNGDTSFKRDFLSEFGIEYGGKYKGRYLIAKKAIRIMDVDNPFTGRPIEARAKEDEHLLKDGETINVQLLTVTNNNESVTPTNIFTCKVIGATIKKSKKQKENIMQREKEFLQKELAKNRNRQQAYVKKKLEEEKQKEEQKAIDRKREQERIIQEQEQKEAERIALIKRKHEEEYRKREKIKEQEEKQKAEEAHRKEAEQEEQKRNVEELRKIVKARKIRRLIHFTRASNLESIIKNGIVSVLNAWDSKIELNRNDKGRHDGRINASSFSIEYPNHYLLSRFIENNPEEKWVILALSPEVLFESKNYYAQHNAATKNIIKGERLNDFNSMYDETISFITMQGNPQCYQRELVHQQYPALPTSEQAEIMIWGTVEAKYIMEIIFQDEGDKRLFLDAVGDITCRVEPEMFTCSLKKYFAKKGRI